VVRVNNVTPLRPENRLPAGTVAKLPVRNVWAMTAEEAPGVGINPRIVLEFENGQFCCVMHPGLHCKHVRAAQEASEGER
jgi:hypothetical protein